MKTILFRMLNLALWLVGSAVASIGLVLAFRLPHGSGARGWTWLGWTRHEWGSLHTYLAYLLIAFVLIHLALHARWLWVVACHRSWQRLVAGLVAGTLLPLFALL